MTVTTTHQEDENTKTDGSGIIDLVLAGGEKSAAGFWARRGMTGGLLTLGFVITVFGIVGTVQGLTKWTKEDMFAALVFGAFSFALGLVSMTFATRYELAREERRIKVFEARLRYQAEIYEAAVKAGEDAAAALDKANADASKSVGGIKW